MDYKHFLASLKRSSPSVQYGARHSPSPAPTATAAPVVLALGSLLQACEGARHALETLEQDSGKAIQKLEARMGVLEGVYAGKVNALEEEVSQVAEEAAATLQTALEAIRQRDRALARARASAAARSRQVEQLLRQLAVQREEAARLQAAQPSTSASDRPSPSTRLLSPDAAYVEHLEAQVMQLRHEAMQLPGGPAGAGSDPVMEEAEQELERAISQPSPPPREPAPQPAPPPPEESTSAAPAPAEAADMQARAELAELRRQLEEERSTRTQAEETLRKQLEEERATRSQAEELLRRQLEEERSALDEQARELEQVKEAEASEASDIAELKRQLAEERRTRSAAEERLQREIDEEKGEIGAVKESALHQLQAREAEVHHLKQKEAQLETHARERRKSDEKRMTSMLKAEEGRSRSRSKSILEVVDAHKAILDEMSAADFDPALAASAATPPPPAPAAPSPAAAPAESPMDLLRERLAKMESKAAPGGGLEGIEEQEGPAEEEGARVGARRPAPPAPAPAPAPAPDRLQPLAGRAPPPPLRSLAPPGGAKAMEKRRASMAVSMNTSAQLGKDMGLKLNQGKAVSEAEDAGAATSREALMARLKSIQEERERLLQKASSRNTPKTEE